MNEPPVAKYKYTLTITGNSHADSARAAGSRSGWLPDHTQE